MIVDLATVSTAIDQLTSITKGLVLITSEIGESPLAGDDNALTTGELVLGAAESLLHVITIGILGANRHDRLTDLHTSDSADGLAISTTHTGSQTTGGKSEQTERKKNHPHPDIKKHTDLHRHS